MDWQYIEENKRKLIFVAAAVIVLILILRIMLWLVPNLKAQSKERSQKELQELTLHNENLKKIQKIKAGVDDYTFRFGKYPLTTRDLTACEGANCTPILPQDTFTDTWGRNIAFESDGYGHFTLKYYGKDGVKGGKDADADMILSWTK